MAQGFLAGLHLIVVQAPWFFVALAMALGAVWGSFCNCVWDRLPRRQSLRRPPSVCDSCGTLLGLPDLVPVLSWLALRGRCRHCGTRVPLRNTLLEVATAALPLALFTVYGLSLAWVAATLSGWLLLLAWLLIRSRPRSR